jgi:hypothetical protein
MVRIATAEIPDDERFPRRWHMKFRQGVFAMMISSAALLVPSMNAAGNPPAEDLLGGPKVSDEAAKEAPRRRGERLAPLNAAETPLRDWMAVLREIDLTDEQKQVMRNIAADMFQERRKFMMSRSESEREMIDQLPRLREQGREPNERQREMLQRMENARPRIEEFQRKMWAQLSLEQQQQFKAKLAELRERQSEDQARRRDGRRDFQPAPDDMMQMQPAQPQRAGEGDGERARRRSAAPADDATQRRLRFLRSRQSAEARQAVRHAEGEPSPRERVFKFEDDQPEASQTPPPAPPQPTHPESDE